MAYFTSHLSILLPFLNNHTFALIDLQSSVGQIDKLSKRFVYILIAKSEQSSQFEENFSFKTNELWFEYLKIKRGRDKKERKTIVHNNRPINKKLFHFLPFSTHQISWR